MAKKTEKPNTLPNSDVNREACTIECVDCDKVFELPGCNVCIAYVSPKALHRLGCALKSNKEETTTNKKRYVNPLKASKRAAR